MAAAGDRPVVHAPAGTVSGETRGGIRAFKGLPYARPPVGDARWKPPAPSAPWQGVRDARSFGPACVQPRSRPGSIYAEDYPAMSEDCLTLNVWTPEHAKARSEEHTSEHQSLMRTSYADFFLTKNTN